MEGLLRRIYVILSAETWKDAKTTIEEESPHHAVGTKEGDSHDCSWSAAPNGPYLQPIRHLSMP